MPTIDETRRLNLTNLVHEMGGNKALAEAVGVSESQMNQWVNGAKDSKTGKPRGMRLASCHRIEDRTGKPRGWLDTQHSPATGGMPAAPPATPLSLAAALVLVLDVPAAIPALRLPAVQATLAQVVGHPEMRDEVAAELLQLLQAPPAKRDRAA